MLCTLVALDDTTLYVYPFSGGCTPVHLKKFDCLLLRGDVAHIGGASEHSQTEILHIYIDSLFPGCERKVYEDGSASATFPFYVEEGYPTAKQIAQELAKVQEKSYGRGKRNSGE